MNKVGGGARYGTNVKSRVDHLKMNSMPLNSQAGSASTPDRDRHLRTMDPRNVPEIPSGAVFAEKERAMKWR